MENEPAQPDAHDHRYIPPTARRKKDVALLSLHRETRRHFAQAGITSLQQIIEMDEATLRGFRQVGAATVKKIKAQAEAFLNECPVWLADLPSTCRECGWFFDIETNPATDQVWSIGWGWHDQPTRIVLVVPGSSGQALTLPDGREVIRAHDVAAAWAIFADSASANQQPIFHWTSFDAGNMRRHAPEAVTNALTPRLHDLYVSFKNTIQLPERSNALKVVAPYAGFRWKGYQEWWAALRDYQQFLATRDPAHLVEACHYQAGDVEAMVAVWRWLNAEQP